MLKLLYTQKEKLQVLILRQQNLINNTCDNVIGIMIKYSLQLHIFFKGHVISVFLQNTDVYLRHKLLFQVRQKEMTIMPRSICTHIIACTERISLAIKAAERMNSRNSLQLFFFLYWHWQHAHFIHHCCTCQRQLASLLLILLLFHFLTKRGSWAAWREEIQHCNSAVIWQQLIT